MGPAVGPGAQTQQIFIPNELVGKFPLLLSHFAPSISLTDHEYTIE